MSCLWYKGPDQPYGFHVPCCLPTGISPGRPVTASVVPVFIIYLQGLPRSVEPMNTLKMAAMNCQSLGAYVGFRDPDNANPKIELKIIDYYGKVIFNSH